MIPCGQLALARFAQDLAEPADSGEDMAVVAPSVPYRFASPFSREAADELSLPSGMFAVAAVKATSVSIEIPKAS